MTHTPGPWKVKKLDGEIYINPSRESGEYALLAKVHGARPRPGRSEDTAQANARLIAAAPEAPHDCEVPDCPGQRNKRLLEATEGLLEACRLALKAQQLRTRKILHQIASEYSNEPPPTPEHTLPEEEEAHNKLTAAIAKAEEVTA